MSTWLHWKRALTADMRLRAYDEPDLPAVLSSWAAASAIAHPFLSAEFLAAERRNFAEVYMPRAQTWVAELDDSVVGYIALMDNEVGAIFLDPQHHGKGIGRALMDHAKSLHDELVVEVFKQNPIGRAFYDKAGFTFEGEYLHLETAQVMMMLKWTRDRP